VIGSARAVGRAPKSRERATTFGVDVVSADGGRAIST
jgi:hypothetical protein